MILANTGTWYASLKNIFDADPFNLPQILNTSLNSIISVHVRNSYKCTHI